MKVILLPEVLEQFEDLSVILYEKEYFSFENRALDYVLRLYDEVVQTLPTRIHKPAPPYFDRYEKNMYYAMFSKNKRTSWYAFFTKYNENGNTVYLVRYIANNHTVAQYL